MAEDDGFERVGEISRQAVKEKVLAMLQPSVILDAPDAQQAVLLGALAATVECFVCAAGEGVSRDRLKAALGTVVADFVDQAKDRLGAGLQ